MDRWMNRQTERREQISIHKRRNSQVPETKDSEARYLEMSSESRTGLWWAGNTTVDLQQKVILRGMNKFN